MEASKDSVEEEESHGFCNTCQWRKGFHIPVPRQMPIAELRDETLRYKEPTRAMGLYG